MSAENQDNREPSALSYEVPPLVPVTPDPTSTHKQQIPHGDPDLGIPLKLSRHPPIAKLIPLLLFLVK